MWPDEATCHCSCYCCCCCSCCYCFSYCYYITAHATAATTNAVPDLILLLLLPLLLLLILKMQHLLRASNFYCSCCYSRTAASSVSLIIAYVKDKKLIIHIRWSLVQSVAATYREQPKCSSVYECRGHLQRAPKGRVQWPPVDNTQSESVPT